MRLENKTMENLTTLQLVLWGQCDAGVQSKLRAHQGFDEDKSNIFELMSILETLCENEGKVVADERTQWWNACNQVSTFKQPDDMTLTDYHKEFKLRAKVAKKAGGKMYGDQHLMEAFRESGFYGAGDGLDKFDLLEPEVKQMIQTQAAERVLAVGFILNASDNQYGEFKRDRINSLSKSCYKYPTTVDAAHTEMEKFKPSKASQYHQQRQTGNPGVRGYNQRRTGHTLVTAGTESEETPKKEFQCWNCDQWNECKKYNCPHNTKEDGSPTKKEARRNQQNGSQLFNDGVESERDNNQTEWEECLEEDPYAIGFGHHINGFEKNKEIIVENLQGKDKHVFNQKRNEGQLNGNWILL